jgi:hypothetical protein
MKTFIALTQTARIVRICKEPSGNGREQEKNSLDFPTQDEARELRTGDEGLTGSRCHWSSQSQDRPLISYPKYSIRPS